MHCCVEDKLTLAAMGYNAWCQSCHVAQDACSCTWPRLRCRTRYKHFDLTITTFVQMSKQGQVLKQQTPPWCRTLLHAVQSLRQAVQSYRWLNIWLAKLSSATAKGWRCSLGRHIGQQLFTCCMELSSGTDAICCCKPSLCATASKFGAACPSWMLCTNLSFFQIQKGQSFVVGEAEQFGKGTSTLDVCHKYNTWLDPLHG